MGENEDLRIQDTENEQLKGGVKCAKKCLRLQYFVSRDFRLGTTVLL